MTTTRSCKIDNCEGQHKGYGYCRTHYRRFVRYGDPLFVPPGRPTPEQRFAARHVPDTSGCWLWQGYVYPTGYGMFYSGPRRSTYAHRYSYEIHVGPIPEGLEIDHLCRVRHCVNPAHLEAVTHAVNVQRALPHRRRFPATACRRGHPLEGDNAAFYGGGDHAQRRCRTCHRDRARARRARLRSAGTNGGE